LVTILQNRDEMIEIMTVDRADVIEPQLLEQRAARDHTAGKFLGALGALFHRPWKEMGDLLPNLP
jgi:hypothetical protein